MSRLIWGLIFLFLIGGDAFAHVEKSDKVKVGYGARAYQIPAHFKAVISIDDRSSPLIFRYGEKKYLAFTRELGFEGSDLDLKCDQETFLAALFRRDFVSTCNPRELNDFTDIFVKNHDVGTWQGKEGLIVYYCIGEHLSFLFLVDSKGNHAKIESDFMAREALKEIVEELL